MRGVGRQLTSRGSAECLASARHDAAAGARLVPARCLSASFRPRQPAAVLNKKHRLIQSFGGKCSWDFRYVPGLRVQEKGRVC